MIFLDTGYFVALLNPADTLHTRAMAWADSLVDPVVTSEYVLVEAINALSRPSLRRFAGRVIEFVDYPTCEIVVASTVLLRQGIALHQSRRDKEWSLTDCISFEIMRQRGIRQALAHDHHFEQAGFDALLRRDPS